MGISPVSCDFNKHQSISSHVCNSHIDTIRALIYNENFIYIYMSVCVYVCVSLEDYDQIPDQSIHYQNINYQTK